MRTNQCVTETIAHVGKVTGLVAVKHLGQWGRVIISAGADGRIKCWRIQSGRWGRPRLVCRQVMDAHHGAVTVMSVAGDRLLTGGADGDLQSWQVGWRGEPRLVGRISAHRGAITAAALSPNGDLVVSGGVDGLTYLWRLSTSVGLGSLPQKANCLGSLPQKAGAVTAVAFSLEAPFVAIGEDAGWVQFCT
ncbi:MAG: hypothetical protein HC805_07585 [Alkalinema sp. RL_2_19]|nr:hypothetical protein [Alkalinema sp. RL_2_19]